MHRGGMVRWRREKLSSPDGPILDPFSWPAYCPIDLQDPQLSTPNPFPRRKPRRFVPTQGRRNLSGPRIVNRKQGRRGDSQKEHRCDIPYPTPHATLSQAETPCPSCFFQDPSGASCPPSLICCFGSCTLLFTFGHLLSLFSRQYSQWLRTQVLVPSPGLHILERSHHFPLVSLFNLLSNFPSSVSSHVRWENKSTSSWMVED